MPQALRKEPDMADLDQLTTSTAVPPATDTSRRALTVALTAVAYFMVTLDALVVVTALPSIQRDLGGTVGTLQWTISAYNTAFAAGIITAVGLGDRLGRRRVYVVGLALFTLSSAACALAPNASVLIGFRVAQGIGAAIVMPLGLTLLTSAFPAERRGAVVGIWGGVAGLGVAAGPLIGGAVSQGLNWHWIFWVNVPVGTAALIGARLHLPESRGPRTRLDLPALFLVSTGVGVLVWGLVQGPQAGWGSARVTVALLVGACLLAGFLVWETRAPEPMIPLRLFRATSFSAAVTTQFFMAATIQPAAFLTSQYFQFARGDSPLATGLRFLPWTATPLLIAPVAGAVFDKVGARRLVVPGLLMQGLGLAWIVHLAGTGAGYGSFVLPFVIAGTGISMALPCVAAAGLNAVPPASLGKAASVLNTLQLFGATIGIAIATVVFDANGSLIGPAEVTNGFRHALAVAAGLSLLAAAAALRIRPTARPSARGLAGAGAGAGAGENQLSDLAPVLTTD
jgi:EmrB/QacA subfamily drug resistance transporter